MVMLLLPDQVIICAGSINNFERISAVKDLGVWGFTIGSAVFDKKLIPEIAKLGIKAICANISLKTQQERKDLAETILNVINSKKAV